MKDLSDNEFDKLLKQKAEAYDFDFDESAWNKMEQKLRRRDRIVFIRNSSIVVVLLVLFGGGYLLFNTEDSPTEYTKVGKGKPDTTRKTKTSTDDIKPNAETASSGP